MTLPAELIHEFKLTRGMSVDVSVHPQRGAVTIRPGVRHFEDGNATKRFLRQMEEIADAYGETFEELAR